MENLSNLLSNYKNRKVPGFCPFCDSKMKWQTSNRSYNDVCTNKKHMFKYMKSDPWSLSVFIMDKHDLVIKIKSAEISVIYQSKLITLNGLDQISIKEAESYINEMLDNFDIIK